MQQILRIHKMTVHTLNKKIFKYLNAILEKQGYEFLKKSYFVKKINELLQCQILDVIFVDISYYWYQIVKHLNEILPHCSILMLDTHIVAEEDNLNWFSYNDIDYQFKRCQEAKRLAPFTGIQDHAKWLLENNGLKHTDYTHVPTCTLLALRRQYAI